MKESIALENVLLQDLQCSAHRLEFVSLFIMGVIAAKSVNFVQIATILNPTAKNASNYRRIQRFFEQFFFEETMLARFVLRQLGDDTPKVICLDRTNWCFGKLKINIMALGIAHRGTAFGFMWSMLPKSGNSNQAERVSLMRRLVNILPAHKIKALVADREFIGKDWFTFLIQSNINFHIRLRMNINAKKQENDVPRLVYALFKNLPVGQALTLHNKYKICGQYLSVTGMKLVGGDYLILVTNGNPKDSFTFYKQRWEIETFFKAIKKTGFDVEQTHLQHTERISTLLTLICIAFVWAHVMGEHLNDHVKSIRVCKHGYLAQSFFRYGLDHLRSIIVHLNVKTTEFYQALRLLSCT